MGADGSGADTVTMVCSAYAVHIKIRGCEKKMLSYLTCLAGKVSHIAAVLSAVAAIAAVVLAIHIPHRILINQLYADLVSAYRSPQMGYAVLSLFAFYDECQGNPELIKERYRSRYDAEIKSGLAALRRERPVALDETLHFQRRLVAHFYWDLARLHLDGSFPRLPKKQIRQFIGANERNVMSIVLQMSEANEACFVKLDTVSEPPDDDVAMNQLIKQLYEKTEDWV